ncbi:hypothetical protein CL634_11120 [bacterium]|nr:hypothetical protein [bacterium]
MTSQEKHVYNSFLRISRIKQNSPYRIRKNFDGFEDDKKYIYIVKINQILKRNKSIQLNDFLTAPYEVYSDGNHYDLKFYTTQRAIKVYTTYIKKRLSSDIDSDEITDKIKSSLFYIYKFCQAENILIADYVKHKTDLVNSFILHIQENHIIMYVLFGFPDFEKELNKMSYEVQEFILGDQINKLDKMRKNYFASKRAKAVITKGITKLKEIEKKA